MLNKELQKRLQAFPDDMEVRIYQDYDGYDSWVEPLDPTIVTKELGTAPDDPVRKTALIPLFSDIRTFIQI